MAFEQCGNEFAKAVRKRYRASIVAVPRRTVLVGHVVAVSVDSNPFVPTRTKIVGSLGVMLKNKVGQPGFVMPELETQAGWDLTGERASNVGVQAAVDLTGKWLAGVGLLAAGGAAPGLAEAPSPDRGSGSGSAASVVLKVWEHADKFTFEVRNVHQRGVDDNELFGYLGGRKVDVKSAAAQRFQVAGVREGDRMGIITRVFASDHIALSATDSNGAGVEASVPALEALFGKASAGVGWQSDGKWATTFKGDRPAVFAIQVSECTIAKDGTLVLGNLQNGKFIYTRSDGPTADDGAQDGYLMLDESDSE